MKDKPLVSIIIPVYNRGKFIKETIDSIKMQTYVNWECILVDDQSNDNSVYIIKGEISKDNRFKLYIRPDSLEKGANPCRNIGFAKSKGDYINWFDSDDLMDKDFLNSKVKAFDLNFKLDGVISMSKFFKYNGNANNFVKFEERTRESENFLEDFLTLKISWYLPDVMWKRTFLDDKTLFNQELKAGQDREFHTRMLIHNPKMKILNQYLTNIRIHEHRITNKLLRDKTYRISHLKSLNDTLKLLKEKNLLSKKIRTHYFISVIKYLPYTIKSKKDLNFQISLLKYLSFWNLTILKGWLKFCLAYLSFRLFNKGYEILN